VQVEGTPPRSRVRRPVCRSRVRRPVCRSRVRRPGRGYAAQCAAATGGFRGWRAPLQRARLLAPEKRVGCAGGSPTAVSP